MSNHMTTPPLVAGQCAEVLSLIRKHGPVLSLDLTANHAIPETAARVHDLRAKGFNIVSDGIAFGAIQIPGDGAPFVQMADRAPTGGYPKIANAIAADLGRLAQMRPGATLRFEAVTVAEAVAAWKTARAGVDQALTGAANGGDLSAEALLGANLVSGVVSAVGGDDR